MAVDCGKGKCVVRSNHKHPFKFVCKCEPSWKQIKAGPKHMFLPKVCVIPESECEFHTLFLAIYLFVINISVVYGLLTQCMLELR